LNNPYKSLRSKYELVKEDEGDDLMKGLEMFSTHFTEEELLIELVKRYIIEDYNYVPKTDNITNLLEIAYEFEHNNYVSWNATTDDSIDEDEYGSDIIVPILIKCLDNFAKTHNINLRKAYIYNEVWKALYHLDEQAVQENEGDDLEAGLQQFADKYSKTTIIETAINDILRSSGHPYKPNKSLKANFIQGCYDQAVEEAFYNFTDNPEVSKELEDGTIDDDDLKSMAEDAVRDIDMSEYAAERLEYELARSEQGEFVTLKDIREYLEGSVEEFLNEINSII